MISVNQLNKYFNRHKRNQIHVLNDVTLNFPEKGLVVLLGPSGSGKTTLLNVIGGLDKVQTGDITFDDVTMKGYDAATWDKIRNEHVGYIFQNYHLLSTLSVYENIAFVLKMLGIKDEAYIESRVNYVLKAVNMYPFRKKKALQLSGGQQQRVAIARALVKNPKVIIADEPTGNLDSKNSLEIMNIIKQISNEKLVVLVTHERDLASFYGTRIIEIKDGKIKSDISNDVSDSHNIGIDDTLYLKDMNEQSKIASEFVNVTFYHDEKDDLTHPLNIRLILKNKTLYLDVKGEFQKIKFADSSSGVMIKDEHFVQKTREELIKTTFNLEELDHSVIHKDKASMVSFKQTLKMAFEKILRTGKKGKLMLFSFLVAGMVVAFTISTLASVAIVRPEPYMGISKGYISTEYKENYPNYLELMALGSDDSTYFINPYGRVAMRFLNPNGSEAMVGFNAQIETVDHLPQFKLIDGKKPSASNEFVITSKIATQLIETRDGQDFGIWNYAQLYQEKFLFGDGYGSVVGIVESEIPMIFMDEIAMTYYYFKNDQMAPFELYDETYILKGNVPVGDQVLVSKAMFDRLSMQPNYDGPWPLELPLFDVSIAGIHTITDEYFVLSRANPMKIRAINEMKSGYIYTSDSSTLITSLKSLYQIEAKDVYDNAFNTLLSSQRVALISSLGTSLLLIGFSMIGFYFVIRSSLISRIYEVSIYRALGVKKMDILRSFIVEIAIITTLTTLVGYMLSSYVLSELQKGLLGELNFFYVTPISVAFGVVVLYLINFMAGLAPVVMLLRKTPAQILSQYDI